MILAAALALASPNEPTIEVTGALPAGGPVVLTGLTVSYRSVVVKNRPGASLQLTLSEPGYDALTERVVEHVTARLDEQGFDVQPPMQPLGDAPRKRREHKGQRQLADGLDALALTVDIAAAPCTAGRLGEEAMRGCLVSADDRSPALRIALYDDGGEVWRVERVLSPRGEKVGNPDLPLVWRPKLGRVELPVDDAWVGAEQQAFAEQVVSTVDFVLREALES